MLNKIVFVNCAPVSPWQREFRMISKIIDWCGKNKFIVSLGMLFIIAWGVWALRTIPLDAIPDISDTQVVVFSRWMKSPDIIEDQVTYPIVEALLGAPKVKAIRASSDFGFSYVYVIFQDGTDVYTNAGAARGHRQH